MEWLVHGAAVHVPLALGVLFPFLYLGALWSRGADWLPAQIWKVLWIFGVVQIVSAGLAYSSGERSKILSGAEATKILVHENLAFNFLAVWLGIVLLLTVVAWVKHAMAAKIAHAFLLALLLVQIFICVDLGKVGGSLLSTSAGRTGGVQIPKHDTLPLDDTAKFAMIRV